MNRRNFLKLGGLLPPALVLPAGLRSRVAGQSTSFKNVLVVIFDAFSACNMSLYGYGRQTTPNIDRLAKRAIVYHDQYAGGNFTSPGTASILTGVYPWTHRAIQWQAKTIRRFHTRNAFSIFGDYHRFAYTHNTWAYTVMRPMASQISQLVPVHELYLETPPAFIDRYLANDNDTGTVAWARSTGLGFDGHAYSLYLSAALAAVRDAGSLGEIRRRFPRGLPGDDESTSFILETAIDWLIAHVTTGPRPFFGYFHMLPPHAPYRTRIEFVDRFRNDGYEAPLKPTDLFGSEVVRDEKGERQNYDEYILYADEEFGRLYAALEAAGVLEDTWLVLTSDHGEVFERGLKAHGTNTLYEPEIRVPLVVFEPGRDAGMHVHTPTSAVDLLPTLAHVTGHELPPWTEGRVLPPYGGVEDGRDVFSLMAEDNNPDYAIHNGTMAVRRGHYKLQYYFGYEELQGKDMVKLFDIEADPEEMVDLAATNAGTTRELVQVLKDQLAAADEPFPRQAG